MMKNGADSQFSILNSQSIKEGALFVADAHYPHHGDAFLDLLKRMDRGEITASQLFLMGDIFDLLFDCGEYIRSFSAEAIALLQKLSERIEIHYFEGNHDFRLKNIFPNINVYFRKMQPITMQWDGRSVGLSHGDRYDAGIGYEIFTYVLRDSPLLCLLKPWEKPLLDREMKRLGTKKICRSYQGFEAKVRRILSHYPDSVDLVIEGHFHQGRQIGKYISLPSLACQGEIGVVRGKSIDFVALEALRV
ncbi:metallophosphoesterase [Nitratifractor sp.]|uniref:UDP-2,3-diacylglucosamine diphosphatase n=1 Tax=Nitratifractor sp. TaxID=2268144 RepID=UPI0025EAA44B|nr:metallophosphoesterase [Nitratifractor sp.]